MLSIAHTLQKSANGSLNAIVRDKPRKLTFRCSIHKFPIATPFGRELHTVFSL